MIHAEFGGTALVVRGHAGSAPAGQDLVCAAASALVGTLEQSLRRLAGAGETERVSVTMQPGHAALSCRDTPAARAAFRVIEDGFGLLARTYPAYVAVTRKPELTSNCHSER